MKETGRLLKEARESQKISLPAVSAVTKINIRVLEAIENGQMESLPSKTFLRGFVQTYANFLKLPQQRVLEAFQKEMGTTKYTPAISDVVEGAEMPAEAEAPLESPPPSLEKDNRTEEGLAFANGGRSVTPKIIFALFSIALVGGIYFITETVERYQKESIVPTEAPALEENVINPTSDASKTLANEKSPTDKEKSDKDRADKDKIEKSVEKTSDKVAEKPPEKVAEKTNIPVSEEANAKTAETVDNVKKPPRQEAKAEVAKPQETKTATKEQTAPVDSRIANANTTATEAAVAQVVEPGNAVVSPQEIVLEALDTVKIDFRTDGGGLQSVTLQPEEKRTFKAKKELKMDVSDGGAVNVNHNGRDKGVPGNLGQPMKLSFP